MEPTFQPSPNKSRLHPLEAQIRDCFGRVAYAHKAHEKCADMLTETLARVKLVQIALSAITTGGIVTVLLGSKEISHAAAVTSAAVSTVLFALNMYMKESDAGQRVERHKEVAGKLWNVRESYLSVLTDLRDGHPHDAVRARRDTLQSELAAIYQTAPRTDKKAYSQAQIGLQRNEELTFSDDEIDGLLPPALRLPK